MEMHTSFCWGASICCCGFSTLPLIFQDWKG
jgi:hypothetical protein